MEIHRGIENFPILTSSVVTQGTFDGVHLGHRKILRNVVETAREMGVPSVLVTFFPHPRLILYPENNELKLLTTLEEKAKIIAEIGIDHLWVLPFTRELSRLKPEEFVRDVLMVNLNFKRFIIGYDHRFGRNREGNLEDLVAMSEAFGFTVEEIPAQDIDDSTISSTKIRKALQSGDVALAHNYMGRPYELSGKVVQGRQQGRKLGYPTANIKVPEPYKLIPANGVYVARVKWKDKFYNGMLSIGLNPTFSDAGWSIEVHIFNFTSDLYGEEISILFLERLRFEEKFEQIEDLIQQLKQDENNALAYFENNPV